MMAVVLMLANVRSGPELRVFVMTDCPISRQYMPELKRIQHDYKLRLTLVHEDPHTTSKMALQFSKEFGLSADYRLDLNHAEAKRLQVKSVPTVALILEGKAVYVGRIDDRFPALGVQRAPAKRELRIALDEVKAGKPVTVSRTKVVGCVIPR